MDGVNGLDLNDPVGFVDGVVNLNYYLVSMILDCGWWWVSWVDHRGGGWSLILVRLDCSYFIYLLIVCIFCK